MAAKVRPGSLSVSKEDGRVIHHFIFVEVPMETVWPEALKWGGGEWWPKNAAVKIVPVDGQDVRVGSKFIYKMFYFFAPQWEAEVTQFVPERLIERNFLSGPFQGKETISAEWRYNGTRIDYELHYRLNNPVHKIFWPLWGEKAFNAAMKRAIDALKTYTIAKHTQQQESNNP